jgi:hypothetical protein
MPMGDWRGFTVGGKVLKGGWIKLSHYLACVAVRQKACTWGLRD